MKGKNHRDEKTKNAEPEGEVNPDAAKGRAGIASGRSSPG